MIPHKLTLTNFIGIRAGLGLDTITLDLDALAGDAALSDALEITEVSEVVQLDTVDVVVPNDLLDVLKRPISYLR